MRIAASATAITWLPFEALERMPFVPLELAVAHYDEPPPAVVRDLDELRRQDAFREANELDAWIDAHFDDEVRFLQELVRVPTDTPPGNNAPHALRTAQLLEAFGFDVRAKRPARR